VEGRFGPPENFGVAVAPPMHDPCFWDPEARYDFGPDLIANEQ